MRIKHFWGSSENAIRIQLVAALIAYFLVLTNNATGSAKRALWYELVELRAGLFHRPAFEYSQTLLLRQRQNLLQHQQLN